jgi:hypothetical protein
MSSQTKATTEDNTIFLKEETENSETVTSTLTTLVSSTDPSGIEVIDVQTVTISVTSTED